MHLNFVGFSLILSCGDGMCESVMSILLYVVFVS